VVLVADADARFAASLRDALEGAGYACVLAADNEQALERWARASLMLISAALPPTGGLDVCSRVRAASSAGVIMYADQTDEMERVIALRVGADDYLTKPFGMQEMLARVEAVLRRAQPWLGERASAGTVVTFGDVTVDPHRREVRRNGVLVPLLPKEYALLWFLLCHPNQPFSPKSLNAQAWGHGQPAESRSITVYMHHLRQKLEEDTARPRYLRTVHRRGYAFCDERMTPPAWENGLGGQAALPAERS
jgi:DNA-binding response OmpR family regulator